MANKNENFKLALTDFLDINNACNIYWYDLDNNLINANQHQLDMINNFLGIKEITSIKSSALKIVDKEIILAENAEVIASGKAKQYFNRMKYGNILMLFITIKAPYYNEKNEIAGVFGISHVLSTYDLEKKQNEKLTMRESECLMELIKGKTAVQIAESLDISKRTVESYMENIKGKLGCNNKSELVNKVYQTGLNSLMEDQTTSEEYKPGVFLPKNPYKD